jgi:DNA-3-methyladenine glycosylase I
MPKITSWEIHHRHRSKRPASNEEYFERMAWVVLMHRSDWGTLEKKWPAIKEAFANFDVPKVAAFTDADLAVVNAKPGLLESPEWYAALPRNARTILELVDEFGSFELYLRALRVAGGEQLQIKDVSKRFARLGHTSTTIVFLYAVGEDTPKALAAWKASHGGRLP